MRSMAHDPYTNRTAGNWKACAVFVIAFAAFALLMLYGEQLVNAVMMTGGG